MSKASKLVPSLIGGSVGGLAPIFLTIPIVGTPCCCLLSVCSGVLAAFLLVRKSNPNHNPVSIGDGFLVGILSGVISSLLAAIVITISLSIVFNKPGFNETFHETIEKRLEIYPQEQQEVIKKILQSPSSLIPIFVVMDVIVLLITNTIGGLCGVLLFEKRKKDSLSSPGIQSGYPGY